MGDGAKGLFEKVGAWFGRWLAADFSTWLVRGLAALLAVLGGAFLFVMLSGDCPKYWSADCPEWWLKAFGVKEKSRVLEYLGIAMAGVLAAMGLVFAHRRSGAMIEANINVEKGQRQERLRDAIGHLGHDRESVRLGGAYELFHLAQDNEELRQTGLDILCAHIRQTTGEEDYRENHGEKPSEEIQSLLTLLFVDEHAVFRGLRTDLQGSWLNGAFLPRARLRRAFLREAHLRGAHLGRANLREALLFEACLQGALLSEAHLEGARLNKAHLQGAHLGRACLKGAVLFGAQLQRGYFAGAHLQGANLKNARLEAAYFADANLQGASLKDAGLRGAYLVGADLRGVMYEDEEHSSSFAERLREGIDRETNLSKAIFLGGLSREDAERAAAEMPDAETADFLWAILKGHIDRKPVYDLPEGSGAIVGAYTAEEAEAWIAEYEEAM